MKLRMKLAAAGLATSAALVALRALRGRYAIGDGREHERDKDRTETRTEARLRVIDGALEDATWLDDAA